MTTAASVRAALMTMLQSINGSGGYPLDLSSTSFHGMEPIGARPAGQQAYLFRGRAGYARADQATLGGWLVNRQYGVSVYADSSDRTNAQREAQLDVIETDILAAVDAALLPGGALGSANVLDVPEVEIVPQFASQPNAAQQPCSALVLITLQYLRGR